MTLSSWIRLAIFSELDPAFYFAPITSKIPPRAFFEMSLFIRVFSRVILTPWPNKHHLNQFIIHVNIFANISGNIYGQAGSGPVLESGNQNGGSFTGARAADD